MSIKSSTWAPARVSGSSSGSTGFHRLSVLVRGDPEVVHHLPAPALRSGARSLSSSEGGKLIEVTGARISARLRGRDPQHGPDERENQTTSSNTTDLCPQQRLWCVFDSLIHEKLFSLWTWRRSAAEINSRGSKRTGQTFSVCLFNSFKLNFFFLQEFVKLWVCFYGFHFANLKLKNHCTTTGSGPR